MIAGVILAAGASTRMGRPKAFLPTHTSGECFAFRLARTLLDAGTDDLIIVVGPQTRGLAKMVAPDAPPFRIVENPQPEQGQLSSILTALEVIDRPGMRAMLVAPVDQPFVSVATVRALLEHHRRSAAAIVRPARRGRHGHPVIFDRRVFDDLRQVSPDVGARGVVHAHQGSILDVEIEDPGAYEDIDTPEDYARILGRSLD